MSKIMIVACEASGDLLGADLMAALKKINTDIHFVGVGGPAMEEHGLETVFTIDNYGLLGLIEVLPSIPRILAQTKELTQLAQHGKIDLVITIDAFDSNFHLVTKIKKKCAVPCIHYVSPKLWAWRRGRGKKMARYLDHVFCIFPCEPAILNAFKVNNSFVGHPVVQRMRHITQSPAVSHSNRLALLPGSRSGEIKTHLPIMLDAVSLLHRDRPELEIVIPVFNSRQNELIKELVGDTPNIQLLSNPDKYQVLRTCKAALCKSGTSNLELALLGIPMVVCYKISPLTFAIVKRLVNIPHVSPVNILAQAELVPELLQKNCTPQKMAQEILKILPDEQPRKTQLTGFATIEELLDTGSDPSTLVAEQINKFLSHKI